MSSLLLLDVYVIYTLMQQKLLSSLTERADLVVHLLKI